MVGSFGKKSVVAEDGRVRISDVDFAEPDLSGGEVTDTIDESCSNSCKTALGSELAQ